MFPSDCDCCEGDNKKRFENKEAKYYHTHKSKAARMRNNTMPQQQQNRKKKAKLGADQGKTFVENNLELCLTKLQRSKNALSEHMEDLEESSAFSDLDEMKTQIHGYCQNAIGAEQTAVAEMKSKYTENFHKASLAEQNYFLSLSAPSHGAGTTYNLTDDDLKEHCAIAEARVQALHYEIQRRSILKHKSVYDFFIERYGLATPPTSAPSSLSRPPGRVPQVAQQVVPAVPVADPIDDEEN